MESTDVNPALQKLKIFIGDWEVTGRHRLLPDPINGKINFSWLNGESFLIMRTDFKESGPPNSTAVIGSDDSAGKILMLYFDDRGVSRIYEMEFKDNALLMWRTFPGFSQRFKGTIQDNGNTLKGIWELCEDDINWKTDLELTYTRIK